MSQLLFEIGCEEIPARFMGPLLAELEQKIKVQLGENRLLGDPHSVTVYGSYRRLAFLIDGVLDKQTQESSRVVLGPPKAIAQNDAGDWQPPAIGFAKKMGVNLDALHFESDDKGRDCLAVKPQAEDPKAAVEVLPELLANVVMALNLPIAMRWGSETIPFVRTIQWLTCLLDTVVVPVRLYDVTATNQSYGHRFLSHGEDSNGACITLSHATDYQSELKKAHVMLDANERRHCIESFVTTHNGLGELNRDLLEEVVYLLEAPTPLMGQFDSRFLELPAIVLEECMGKHQKYFPVYENGKLKNQFIVIADNVTDTNKATIIKGNEKVLAARLDDASFFWAEDTKKSLAEYNDKLKNVVFQKDLGSIWDKKERLKQLVLAIATQINVDSKVIEDAADLSKADLVTQMVFEFPSLQGRMGYEYALVSGVKKESADAILEQYMPVSEKSVLPRTTAGSILAIADRLDTMVACFENGNIPTGSKDPWGIRKSMVAITRIIINDSHFKACSISQLLDFAYASFQSFVEEPSHRDELLAFFKERIKNVFILNDTLFSVPPSPDMVDAVLAVSMNVYTIRDSLEKMAQFKSQNELAFKKIVDTGVRIARLAKESRSDTVDEGGFKEVMEKQTWDLFQACKNDCNLIHLEKLSESLTEYFDKVLVMDKDDAIKHNRLAMITQIDHYFKHIFDAELLMV